VNSRTVSDATGSSNEGNFSSLQPPVISAGLFALQKADG
jgi:hypothetical protein